MHERRRGRVASQAWQSLVTTRPGATQLVPPPRGHVRRQASKSTWRLLPWCLVAAVVPDSFVLGCRADLPRSKRERSRGLHSSHNGRKRALRVGNYADIPSGLPQILAVNQDLRPLVRARREAGTNRRARETYSQPYVCLLHDIRPDASGNWASTSPRPKPPHHVILHASRKPNRSREIRRQKNHERRAVDPLPDPLTIIPNWPARGLETTRLRGPLTVTILDTPRPHPARP